MSEDSQPRIPEASSDTPSGKNETAKISYTTTGYGNDHGSLHFGKIDRYGTVTAGVVLQARDGRQQLSMDNDGERKGFTTLTTPANFSLRCATDKTLVDEAKDTLSIISDNGNIVINAGNGKIRMQATDIEMIAVGEGGSKGHIKMSASESVSIDCKKFLASSSAFYRISSVGYGEVSTCGPLTIYGMMIHGITASVAIKDSKVGGQLFQRLSNVLTAVNVFRQNSARN